MTQLETLQQTLGRVITNAAAKQARKDPTDEGLEVTYIKFFEKFPEGTDNRTALTALNFVRIFYGG